MPRFLPPLQLVANGLKYFQLKRGWHSYDLDMTGPWDLDGLPNSSLPAVSGTPWGGRSRCSG